MPKNAYLRIAAGLTIDHVAIAVKSIDAVKSVYALLGMPVLQEETVAHEQVRTAMLDAGNSKLELLEPTSAESTVGRFLARRGEGLHHVALRVEDLEERFLALQNEGVRLASERIQIGAGGQRYFFVHPSATGGVLIELVEVAQ